NAVTKTTAIAITNEGYISVVTASAEQIPNTCTVMGLSSFNGSVISFFSAFPNLSNGSFSFVTVLSFAIESAMIIFIYEFYQNKVHNSESLYRAFPVLLWR